MIRFTATLKKFADKGEKSGWTYLEVPGKIASKISPGSKKSFRVKGLIDSVKISGVSVLPMGDGNFIIAVNGDLRKKLRKTSGANVDVALEQDLEQYKINEELIACLADEPAAKAAFEKMPPSHQRYYSKWIESARTESTRIKRIASAVQTLAKNLSFSEMLRTQSDKP